MNLLREKKPILHAVLWIVLYIVLVNLGDALSEQTSTPYMGTSLLQMAFAVLLIVYLSKNGLLKAYGIQKMTQQHVCKVLFYMPLVLLIFMQFISGVNRSLSMTDIAFACLFMTAVGFVEEVIFRGFLFQGIRERSGVNRAIVISGVTFGLGHIVNLLRGYGFEAQAGQILTAVVIGIILALLVAMTKNLVPGILFHILFNIGGTITNSDQGSQSFQLAAILAVSLPYAFYLFIAVRKSSLSQAQTE